VSYHIRLLKCITPLRKHERKYCVFSNMG
jgi:hypothetical protein